MSFPWTPVIGAAGSLGSSLISNIGAKRREREAQKQNVEFWNMQNRYNTPKQQMQRLKDAGLNPNLIYGSSPAGAGGNAGSISPAKAAPYSIQNPVPPSNLLIASQVELNRTNSTKNLAQSAQSTSEKNKIDALVGEQRKQLQIGNDLAALRLDIGNSTKPAVIKQAVAQANTSEFLEAIKEVESEYASRGLKMDTIGQIMTALNLSPTNPQDQMILKAMIGTWMAAGLFKTITPGIGTILKNFNK